MKQTLIINVLLTLLIIGLYAYLNQDPVEPETKTLSSLTPDDIKHIAITQAGTTKLKLQKNGSQWQINSPFIAPANLTRVQLLLSLLSQQVDRQHPITSQHDLATFGIDEQSLSLRLNEATLTFGHVDPLYHQRYIHYQNTIYLLEDTVYPLLNSAATNFIDNHLFGVNTDLSSLTLPMTQNGTISPHKITLNKINGQWQSQPQRPVDTLMSIVEAWQHAQAMQVLPLSLLKQTPDINTRKPVYISTEQQQHQFDITLSSHNVMIINHENGLVYQFPASLHQQLLLPVE